jgi:hypothetical protein
MGAWAGGGSRLNRGRAGPCGTKPRGARLARLVGWTAESSDE